MRTILIVDDQPSVRATLAYILNLDGYGTLLAGSGKEAAALAETQSFDVALVDLHMPSSDGIAVCRALREQAQLRGKILPVWLMTAAYTNEAAAHAATVGARGLLKKPFDCAEWLRELERYFANAKSASVGAPVRADDPRMGLNAG